MWNTVFREVGPTLTESEITPLEESDIALIFVEILDGTFGNEGFLNCYSFLGNFPKGSVTMYLELVHEFHVHVLHKDGD